FISSNTMTRRFGLPGSSEGPGVPCVQECLELSYLLLAGGTELLGHQLVVDATFDVSEYADGCRTAGVGRQAAQREGKARLGVAHVMPEQFRLDVNVDDLDTPVRSLPHALLLVLA